jgi:lipoprotein-anchoring transpeptidase ErfK/SrfK
VIKILAFLFFSTFIFVLSIFSLTPEFRQSLSYRIFPKINDLQKEKYLESIVRSEGEFVADDAAFFENKKVAALRSDFIPRVKEEILAATVGQEKWIEIDLSDQKLYAWEGNQKIFEFVISSGKPWTPTIKGEYRIWIKLRYHTMIGGSRARGDYYRLPNVPYVMYFYKGYGIHGTYWHNNFGRPMSHGCVNLRTPDAEKLFWWAQPYLSTGKSVILASSENPGTKVVVHK